MFMKRGKQWKLREKFVEVFHADAKGNNNIMYFVEGQSAFEYIVELILKDNRLNCGVATAQRKCNDEMWAMFRDAAESWSQYSKFVLCPDSNYSGYKRLATIIKYLSTTHPQLMPKLRFCLSPLYVPTDENNNEDVYYNLYSTRNSPTFIGCSKSRISRPRSHRQIAVLNCLSAPRLWRLLDNYIEIHGNWTFPENMSVYARQLANTGLERFDRIPERMTTQMYIDRLYVPAVLGIAELTLPHAIDGQISIMRKAVAHIRKTQRASNIRCLVYGIQDNFGDRTYRAENVLVNQIMDSNGSIRILRFLQIPLKKIAYYWQIEVTDIYTYLVPIELDFKIGRSKHGQTQYEKLYEVPVLPTLLIADNPNVVVPQVPVEELYNQVKSKLLDSSYEFPIGDEKTWRSAKALILHTGELYNFTSHRQYMNYYFNHVLQLYLGINNDNMQAALSLWESKLDDFYNFFTTKYVHIVMDDSRRH